MLINSMTRSKQWFITFTDTLSQSTSLIDDEGKIAIHNSLSSIFKHINSSCEDVRGRIDTKNIFLFLHRNSFSYGTYFEVKG